MFSLHEKYFDFDAFLAEKYTFNLEKIWQVKFMPIMDKNLNGPKPPMGYRKSGVT